MITEEEFHLMECEENEINLPKTLLTALLKPITMNNNYLKN